MAVGQTMPDEVSETYSAVMTHVITALNVNRLCQRSVDKHFSCSVALALDIDAGHEIAGVDAHSLEVEIFGRVVPVDEVG